MSAEMEQLFPEIYNTEITIPSGYSDNQPNPSHSFNYGVNMWSPLNQWFDENRDSYDQKLQKIGGHIGEGAGVLGAYLGGHEDPLSLLNLIKKGKGAVDSNQNQNNTNANQNDTVENNNQILGTNTGNLVENDPFIGISSQYNSGPGLFSWQTGKDLLNLGTGALSFGAQEYDGDIDYNKLILEQGGTGPHGSN